MEVKGRDQYQYQDQDLVGVLSVYSVHKIIPSTTPQPFTPHRTAPHRQREEMETANEISEAIGRPVDDAVFDDDELLNELNELEEDDLEAMLTPASQVEAKAPALDLPDAPVGGLSRPAAAQEEDEDEKALRELEASMAM